MGRWKLGPQGGYYDANDSGPDQYMPTPAERASQGGGEQGGYAPPTGGVSGYGGGMDPRTGQPMPFPTMPMPPGGFPQKGDPGRIGFDDPKPAPGTQIPFQPIPGGGLSQLNTIAGQPQDLYGGNPPRDPEGRTIQDIFANRAGTPPAGWHYQPGDPSQATDQGPYAWRQPEGPQFPGDSTLPGYGDWNTSNPWRDSLSYQQIMAGAGHQPGSVFGAGASTGSMPNNGLSGTVLNRIFGSVGSAPKTTGGGWGNIFGGLGSLTKSAGAAIGPYGTPR